MAAADRAEFSQLADKFLQDMAVGLNQTPADAEMVDAAPPAAPSTSTAGGKRSAEAPAEKPAAESDSEEAPSVAVVSMDTAKPAPQPAEAKKEKKEKPAAPAVEGDLSVALKKKPAKKKAGTK